MELRFGGARYSALIERGYGLDAIGALSEVGVLRSAGETDQAYRERLIIKLDWLCGFSKPIAIDMADFGQYRLWLEKSTPVEVNGLQYLVQSVSFENGRAGAWLMPAIPLQLVDCGWRSPTGVGATALADDTKPNHVRDAVRANQ